MPSLAVVPIFVNAVPALLPAVLAGAATAAAVLFKPRELVQFCRTRPAIPLGALGGILLLTLGGFWLFGGGGADAAKGAGRSPTNAAGLAFGQRDWAKVALDILDREEAGALGTSAATGPPTAQPGAAGRPLGLGRDPTRCGYDGGPAPLGLKRLWQHNEDATMFLSSPLIAGDRVYGASCQFDVTGKYGAVFCLDAQSGKPLWQTTTAGDENLKPFFSSPALTADGRFLLIGQGLHDDKDCALLCLDAATGQVRWQVKTPLHLESSPAVHGDTVVIGAGAIEGKDHKPTGDPGFVLAVRISDGRELWRHPVNDPESSPAIGEDGTVYIGSGINGNAVVALRIEPDDELRRQRLPRQVWKTDAPYPVTGDITLTEDLAIIGAGNGDYVYASPQPAGVVLALDRKTGQVRFSTPMPDAVLGAIACRNRKLICPVRNGEVVALDATDGKLLWRQRISGDAAVLGGPAFTGNYVYAISRDGYLAVLDAADGRVIEKTFVNEEGRPGEQGLCLSSPTIALGRVFIGSETGGLRCYAGTKSGGAGR